MNATTQKKLYECFFFGKDLTHNMGAFLGKDFTRNIGAFFGKI